MALVNTKDGTISANYEYGPFGEVLRSSGAMAKVNPIRFSTKYQDDESDLLYYGYRYYSPSTGRWLSRDPLEEIGGYNMYAACRNDMLSFFDTLGEEVQWHHIFPQAVWRDFEKILVKSGFSEQLLHSEKWGWMLDKAEHSFLHNQALEEDLNYVEHWRKWIAKQTKNGTKTITFEKIAAHAQYIVKKSKWKDSFKVGVRAKWTYRAWNSTVAKEIKEAVAKKIEKLMVRRATRVAAEGATAEAPPIELGVTAVFFVCDLLDKDTTVTEAVLGNLPYIGIPYSIARMASKDKAIEKEMTERVYTQGVRTPPDFGVAPDDDSDDGPETPIPAPPRP